MSSSLFVYVAEIIINAADFIVFTTPLPKYLCFPFIFMICLLELSAIMSYTVTVVLNWWIVAHFMRQQRGEKRTVLNGNNKLN